MDSMSGIYLPLEKSIELLQKDKTGNPYIALSLINLKSHKKDVKLTEDKYFGKSLILNKSKEENERMQKEVKEMKKENQRLKEEKENLEVFTDARINNLTETVSVQDERINNLLEGVSIRDLTINILKRYTDNLEDNKQRMEKNMSNIKRKLESNDKEERNERKRKRFVSA